MILAVDSTIGSVPPSPIEVEDETDVAGDGSPTRVKKPSGSESTSCR